MFTEFEQTTVESLAMIKEAVVGIKEHLGTLNGKVIAHEKAIAELRADVDVRRNQCPLANSVRDELRGELKTVQEYITVEKTTKAVTGRLLGMAKPALIAIAGAVAALLLGHMKMVTEFFAKH